MGSVGVGCSSLPEPKVKWYAFPDDEAFVAGKSAPAMPYENLGVVRTKVNFRSLDPLHEEDQLCANYYNKAVRDLVRRSKDKGGDAVVEVKSVVFLENGRFEEHATPECADDGQEGQILVQGLAVKWKKPVKELKEE